MDGILKSPFEVEGESKEKKQNFQIPAGITGWDFLLILITKSKQLAKGRV